MGRFEGLRLNEIRVSGTATGLRETSYKGVDFIVPKVELYINLPDDPRIETITIYKPRPKDPLDSGSAIELDQLGTLKLSK